MLVSQLILMGIISMSLLHLVCHSYSRFPQINILTRKETGKMHKTPLLTNGPFVLSFRDWKFPHILPKAWQKYAKAQVDSTNCDMSHG